MKRSIIKTFLIALVFTFGAATVANAQFRSHAWGFNQYGQIGDGTSGTNRTSPTSTNPAMSDVFEMHGGVGHTLAVRANGAVWAWGLNNSGQLGNGTVTTTGGCNCLPTPAAVPGVTDVISVSGGAYHSLALKADGTVWAWGHNGSGQIGDGTSANTRPSPLQVGAMTAGFTDIVAIDAGFHHNLALKSDGSLWAWGENISGPIGDGTSGTNRTSPVQITTLGTNIIAISAGAYHSMALTKNGQVYVWGSNGDGQVGNGALGGNVLTPTLNTTLTGVSQIQAGFAHSVALKPDGTVHVWGANFSGQLGNGTSGGNILTPTQNATMINVTDISAENSEHTLARRRDGTIWAWGSNSQGQIGNGASGGNVPTPFQVPVPHSPIVNVVFGSGFLHSLLSQFPTVPAPIGTNITSRFMEGGFVVFSNVTAAGTVSAWVVDPTTTGLTVPSGYTIIPNSQGYGISSSAASSGNTQICVKALIESETEFAKVRLLHGESGALVDRTSSRYYPSRQVCATSTPAGDFVLAKVLAPTAASVSIGGRVFTPNGRGLSNAFVYLTDANGNTQMRRTTSFGYYRFDDMPAGQTVILTVVSKRYQFAPQIVSVTEEITGLDFFANPSKGID